MGKKPVNASDSNVIEMLNAIAHKFRRNNGFFGHRNVAGSCRDDSNDSFAVELVVAIKRDASRDRAVFKVRNLDSAPGFAVFETLDFPCSHPLSVARIVRPALFVRKRYSYSFVLFFCDACRQNVASMSSQPREDLGHLRGSFALAEHDFWHALPKRSVMVELGEAQILKRKMAESLDSLVGGKLLGADFGEEPSERVRVHGCGYFIRGEVRDVFGLQFALDGNPHRAHSGVDVFTAPADHDEFAPHLSPVADISRAVFGRLQER